VAAFEGGGPPTNKRNPLVIQQGYVFEGLYGQFTEPQVVVLAHQFVPGFFFLGSDGTNEQRFEVIVLFNMGIVWRSSVYIHKDYFKACYSKKSDRFCKLGGFRVIYYFDDILSTEFRISCRMVKNLKFSGRFLDIATCN